VCRPRPREDVLHLGPQSVSDLSSSSASAAGDRLPAGSLRTAERGHEDVDDAMRTDFDDELPAAGVRAAGVVLDL